MNIFTLASGAEPESTSAGWHLFILFLAILANAFFTASETAIISLNDAKVRKDAEGGSRTSRTLRRFIDAPGKFVTTIKVGSTLAGFLASAFAALTFAEPIAEWLVTQPWHSLPYGTVENIVTICITIVFAFFTLVFGVFVPKRVAMRHCEKIADAVAGPLRFVAVLTAPFVKLLDFTTNTVLKLFGIDPNETNRVVSEEEIRMMVDISEEKGAIGQSEKEMIVNVFDFNNTTASEIMVHRKDIVALSLDVGEDECRNTLRKSGLSRIPVYNGSIDNIEGILNTRDYLLRSLDDSHPKLAPLLRKAFFVPETIRADVLLSQMQKGKHSMAIVLDEFGGTSGLLTVEDLLEEIVGEIYDEYDTNDKPGEIVRVSDDEFRIPGETDIDVVSEELDVRIEDGEYNTLGGFIFDKLSSVPTEGARLDVPELGLEMTVEKMDAHRIDSVLVRKLNTDHNAEETPEE